MKKLISYCSALLMLLAITTACSDKAEYTHVIPADVTAIASFDLESLIDKSGINDKENNELKQKGMDALKSEMNAATFLQLEKAMKNPSETGIDFGKPVYLFSSHTLPHSTIVVKIDDQDKLKEYLTLLVNEQVCQPITEAQGYSYTNINGFGMLAFNQSTMLLIDVNGTTRTEKAKETLTTLFKQTADESYVSNDQFKKMKDQKGDITFLISMAALPNVYSMQANLALPEGVNVEEMMMLGTTNFTKGKITAKLDRTATNNKELEALYKESEKMMLTLNNNSAKFFPLSTLAYLSMGIQGDELYKSISKNPQFANNTSLTQADEIQKLLSSIDGDFTIGLLDVSMEANGPTFLAYADVKNGDALKSLYANQEVLNLSKSQEFVQLGEEEYVFKMRGTNLFFGVRDKQFYATNNELVYKEIGKASDKSIKDAAYASEMSKKCMFSVINIEAILDLPVVKLAVAMGGSSVGMAQRAASLFTYFDMTAKDYGSVEFNLVFKDKDVNALKQMVNFAKDAAGM